MAMTTGRRVRAGRALRGFGLAMAIAASLARPAAAQEIISDPVPRTIPKLAGIALAPIAEGGGLTAPNWGTTAPGQPNLLFVSDQPGRVWKVDLDTRAVTVFLDVSNAVDLVSTGERGLLGLAFHPDYADNGRFYTYTSEGDDSSFPADFATPPGASTDHDSVVTEWRVNNPADPAAAADPSSRRVLMRIAQPQSNHNAGALAFLPDGTLLIALGDGGGSNDQGAGHVPGGNAQEPGNVLGSVLRIDPLGSDACNGAYGVPEDNPFHPGDAPPLPAGCTGPFGGDPGCADGVCDETYAYGFRNLFRLSVDRLTGTVIGGDVGQRDIEEVNWIVAGGNYGWPVREGSFCLEPGRGVSSFFDCAVSEQKQPERLPVVQYDHDEGFSVIGGYLYRGSGVAELFGRYIFGDFIGGDRQGGRLFYLSRPIRVDNRFRWLIFELAIQDRERLGYRLLGFGEDSAGELYVLGAGAGGGIIEQIVPAQ